MTTRVQVPLGTGISDLVAKLLVMAAQLGERLIGEPESAAVQVHLPGGGLPAWPWYAAVMSIAACLQHRAEERGVFLRGRRRRRAAPYSAGVFIRSTLPCGPAAGTR